MCLRALQMSTAAWLLLTAVLIAGTLGRTIRRPRPADDVTWRAIPSTNVVVQRTARVARRAAVAPMPSGRKRSKVDRAEERKAAAMLLLLMFGGRERLAAVPR